MAQAAAAAAAAAAIPAPVPPRVVVFALAPAAVDNDLIDYTTKEGLKQFEVATKSLQNQFDGQSQNMTVFKGDLGMHATNHGWNNGMQDADIITIP